MKRALSVTVMSVSALLCPILAAHAQTNLNTSGVRFWLERADVIRGPENWGEDNYYNSYMIGSGSFRGFTANACWPGATGNCTQAVDGTAAWDAAASTSSTKYHKNVLTSQTPPAPSWAPCGQWINSNIVYGGAVYGFVHGENLGQGDTNCSDYAHHHKTMTQWKTVTGSGAGLAGSWTNPVLVIDSTVDNSNKGESGEGDCTAISDSVYAYLFCRQGKSTDDVVAREPLSSLSQSGANFIKYDSGWGSQPGVDGADSTLTGQIAGKSTVTTHLGSSASYWKDQNWIMLMNVEDIGFGGIKTSFTSDSNLQSNAIGFTTLPEPLFLQEPSPLTGGYPYGNASLTVGGKTFSAEPVNLYIYPSALSLADGTRTWDIAQNGQFLLAYTDVPLYNNLDTQRILAMRSVTVTTSTTAQDPQMLVALTTRYDSNYQQYYSSTQPLAVGDPSTVPWTYTAGTFTQIVADPVGYLAQKPISQGQTLTKLVECRNNTATPWPGSGHPDHLITDGTCDANYAQDTVAGYSFPSKPGTGNSVEIFRCSSSVNQTHFVSSSSNCGGLGTNEKSLGWLLTK